MLVVVARGGNGPYRLGGIGSRGTVGGAPPNRCGCVESMLLVSGRCQGGDGVLVHFGSLAR